jgi:hypothetical protein
MKRYVDLRAFSNFSCDTLRFIFVLKLEKQSLTFSGAGIN